MGIVGYGDIGRATARLAKAYGMKVLALSRKQQSADDNGNGSRLKATTVDTDPYIDERLPPSDLNRLFQESDYVLCALPLTPATRGLIGVEQFKNAKIGSVFINVGRGAVVDEDALVQALQQQEDRRLRGAALDVFATEPLPPSSVLWTLDESLLMLSPHNMDYTATSQKESTAFFVQVQLPRFVRGLPLFNPVDPTAGY